MELFGTLKAKVEGYVGSDIEKKVKEATGPENWNVSNTLKNEIASATFRYAQFKEIMPIIWDRLDSDPVLWRMIIKSLTLIEHLMRLGSEWVLEDVRDHIYRIRSLNHFRYTDDDGNEYGSGIRETSKKIADYLKNPETLKEAREASASTSGSNYVGMSSSGSMSRSSHQSSGRSTYGGYGSETQSSTRNASSYPAPRSYQQESSQSHAQRTSSSTAYGYPAPPQSQVSRPTENSATRQSKVEKPIASKPKPKATTTGAIKVSAKPITESPANLVALAPPPGETSLASSANKPQADPFSVLDQATTNDDDGFDEIVNFESAPTDTSASNATDDIFVQMQRERSALSKAKRRGKAIEYNESGQMDYVLGAQQRNVERVRFGHKKEAEKKKAALADERRSRRRELDKLVREHFPEDIIVDDDEPEEEAAPVAKSNMTFEDEATFVTVETEDLNKTSTKKKSKAAKKTSMEDEDTDAYTVKKTEFGDDYIPGVDNVEDQLAYFNQAEASDDEPVVKAKPTKASKKLVNEQDVQIQLSQLVRAQEKLDIEYTKKRTLEEKQKKELMEKKAAERLEKSRAGNIKKLTEQAPVEPAKTKNVAEKKRPLEKSEDAVTEEAPVKKSRSQRRAEREAEARLNPSKPKVEDVESGPIEAPVKVMALPKEEVFVPIVMDKVDPLTELLFSAAFPEHWVESFERKHELEIKKANGEIDADAYDRQMNESDDESKRDLSDIFGLGPACLSGRLRKKPLSKKVDNSSNARKERKQERLRKAEDKVIKSNDVVGKSWGYDSDGDVSDDMSEYGTHNKKRKAFERKKKAEDKKGRSGFKVARSGANPTRDGQAIAAAKKAGYYFGEKSGTINF